MAAQATISITPIANGFVVADATGDPYGRSEWRVAESVFYATLDDLVSAMPDFVRAAVESASERDKQFRERLAQEEANYPSDVRGQIVGGQLAQRARRFG